MSKWADCIDYLHYINDQLLTRTFRRDYVFIFLAILLWPFYIYEISCLKKKERQKKGKEMRTSSIFKGEDIKQKSRTRFNVEADWGNNDSSRNIAQLFWLIWKCFKGSSWAVFLGLPRDSLVLPSQASKLWLDTPKNLGSKLELTCLSDTLKN